MDAHYKVLLAEDEKQIGNIVKKYLENNGYEVDYVADGTKAKEAVNQKNYDIVILDIMMPGMSGTEVCKYIRQKFDVPIIFLTALNEEQEILNGYEIGADEYLTKPFSTKILGVKIDTLIKRYHGLVVKNGQIKVGEIIIEPARRMVTVNDNIIALAPKEYDLLIYFIENKNQILTRNQILDRIWGDDFEGFDRVVDSHIKKLRAALGEESKYIETIIKVGYRWNQ